MIAPHERHILSKGVDQEAQGSHAAAPASISKCDDIRVSFSLPPKAHLITGASARNFTAIP